MNKAVALANNDTVLLSWIYDSKIPNCLGFAVYRKDASGTSTALPAWVGFQGDSNPTWQPKDTTVWPVQKFTWRDFEAKRGATYSYEIVPMTGSKGALQPAASLKLTTDAVTLTPKRGAFSSYFNRGILSTQALTRALPKGQSGGPSTTALQGHIDTPGDPLRLRLAGQILEGLTLLLNRAESDGGECYCALYELNDPELIAALLKAGKKVHIILSNTGSDDAENKPARQKLHQAGIDITDRMLANGHIGHNKFMLYVDGSGKPKAVLSGSTNWSYTGVCTQCNNALIFENDELAAAYLDYWKRLKADGKAQGPTLRQSDKTPVHGTIDGSQATVWYSPNTTQKSKPTHGAATPPDMAQVFQAMAQAKYAVLFVVFQPGTPSIIQYAAACENAKPGLIVYGAATDPQANNEFDTLLVHRSTKDTQTIPPDNVVVASAVNTQFAYWQKELLKLPGAHAIIHDKIVVIDPMSDDCVVITGSHNLGYRASYNNDENLVIVKGDKALAQAYATHVMDVYDHYRWRFTLGKQKTNAFSGLDPTPAWQDKYFQQTSLARKEALFWTGQSKPLPAVPAPPVPTSPPPARGGKSKSAAKGGKTKTKKARKATPKKARKTAKKKGKPAKKTMRKAKTKKATAKSARTRRTRARKKTKRT
jgi:phosphatidylserine/phosphatidylglycerophosphate/cardiolipin synthase-like enzyme